jgi:hypothetical protein
LADSHRRQDRKEKLEWDQQARKLLKNIQDRQPLSPDLLFKSIRGQVLEFLLYLFVIGELAE